jgi:ABC-type lipoprotein export system ATPase subunit
VAKHYTTESGQSVAALQSVSLSLPAAKTVAIVGRSGSGKSTLLHLAAGIDTPTAGGVSFAGMRLQSLSDPQRSHLRRQRIGQVFQFFHLLGHLSIEDNILLPAYIAGAKRGDYVERMAQLLRRVRLDQRSQDLVRHLSGGEMQRVAICRALLMSPQLLLADEPTGNLDDQSSAEVMDLIYELAAEASMALMVVTHSEEVARRADETWHLHSGRLETA